MSEILLSKKAFIPYVKEFPVEETKAWGEAVRDSIQKTIKGTLKAVPDDETFRYYIRNHNHYFTSVIINNP